MHTFFTPDRHRMIVEHLTRKTPNSLLVEQLINDGVPEDQTQTLIEKVTQLQEQAKAMKPSGSHNYQVQTKAEISKVDVPQPVKEGFPSKIDLGDVIVRVSLQMTMPRLFLFENVLTHEECDALIELACPSIVRSTVVNDSDGSSVVSHARTSSSAYFHKGQQQLVDKIDHRIAKLIDWPYEKGEGLQILRYEPGQEYTAHHDWFSPDSPGSSTLISQSGNRVATVIMYLNDVEEGGATSFPESGLHIMPKKGNALFFSYDCASVETKTLHAGSPVISGTKWIATKWLRERHF